MTAVILAIVSAIVPILGNELLSLFSTPSGEATKRQWVTNFAADLTPLLNKYIPANLQADDATIIQLVETGLNEALDKLEGANSADTVPVADSSGAAVNVQDSTGQALAVKTAKS